MQDARYDLVGIGNAIVDIIGRCDDAFLSKHDLDKGRMHLIDAKQADNLYAPTLPFPLSPVAPIPRPPR